jgi:hypothetical protein
VRRRHEHRPRLAVLRCRDLALLRALPGDADPCACEIDVTHSQLTKLAHPQPRADRDQQEIAEQWLGRLDQRAGLLAAEVLVDSAFAWRLDVRDPGDHLPAMRHLEDASQQPEVVGDRRRRQWLTGSLATLAGFLAHVCVDLTRPDPSQWHGAKVSHQVLIDDALFVRNLPRRIRTIAAGNRRFAECEESGHELGKCQIVFVVTIVVGLLWGRRLLFARSAVIGVHQLA